jgi:hypothetical protein
MGRPLPCLKFAVCRSVTKVSDLGTLQTSDQLSGLCLSEVQYRRGAPTKHGWAYYTYNTKF